MSTLRPVGASVLGAVLLCASCRGVAQVRGDGFVLESPFGREGTQTWRTLVGDEVSAVTAFLGAATPSPPVVVRLDEVDVGDDADLVRTLNPDVGGIHAWEVAGAEIHLLVSPSADGLFSTSIHRNLRHELSHVFLHRTDRAAAPWFDEGLAEEIEDTVDTATGLRLHPAPNQVVLARALVPGADLATVWTWDGGRTPVPEQEAVIRAIGRSFVRFLIERTATDDWRTQLAQLATIRPADDPALVAAWRGWLDAFDIAARIDAGVRSDDVAVRSAAAAALPELADAAQRMSERVPSLGDALDARTDALAVRLVTDAACADSAGRYLVFFRARALPESAIRGLSRADAPATARLVGLAIEASRGRPPDAAGSQTLWSSLAPSERNRLVWLRLFLPLDP